MKSRALTAYVVGVDLAAVALLALLPATGLRDRIGALFLLVALAAIVGSRPIRIPRLRMQVTAGDMFVLCALVAVAPVAAPLVALAAVVGSTLGRRRRPLSIRTAFNFGALPVAASAAALTFAGLLGGSEAGLPGIVVPLAAASATFFVVNAGLASAAIALESARSINLAWLRALLWNAVTCVTSLLIAMGLFLMFEALGTWALALGLVATLPLLSYFRMHRARAEEAPARRTESQPSPIRRAG